MAHRSHTALLGLGLLVLTLGTGCGSLSQPFDQLKTSGAQVTMYRLQNYEPPAQQAAAGATSLIPPQIQTWLQGAAAALPPGLIPPGLLPNTTAPAADPTAPRFHNFRILGWMTLSDSKQIDEAYDLFGKEKHFENTNSNCMYADFGFSFSGQPNTDVLISSACHQVQAFNFAWPYGSKTGITNDGYVKLVNIAKATFGG